MKEELSVETISSNIQTIKGQYAQYKTGMEIVFRRELPLPVVNLDKQINWLFANAEFLLSPIWQNGISVLTDTKTDWSGEINPREKECADGLRRGVKLRKVGRKIQAQLQCQIDQLNCQQKAIKNLHPVKETLVNIRICFCYLMSEMEEAGQFVANREASVFQREISK